jgi:hypothetical protein
VNETFISYSRKDKEFVGTVVQSLQKTGIDLWIDEADIPAASIWKQEILVGIQFAHNFIYVISPDSIESEYCNLELDYALSLNKRIIPIVARLCSDIRPAISELNWIFFDDFKEGIESLLELLDSPLGTTLGNRIDSQIRITDKLGQRTFPLYRNQYRIGRNPSAEFSEAGLFRLGDESVSRCHATLLRREGRWVIVDGLIKFNERGKPTSYNKSRNGVIVKRLSEKGKLLSSDPLRPMQLRPLSQGDVIVLTPDTSFIYEEISPDNQFRLIEGDDRDTLVNG